MTRPVRAALTALGCKVNYAEMAELAGRLAAAGIELVGEDEPADVRVLNSCTVTVQADATTRQRISRLRRADPAAHLVLTGCSVDANPGRYPALVDSVFGEPPPVVNWVASSTSLASWIRMTQFLWITLSSRPPKASIGVVCGAPVSR